MCSYSCYQQWCIQSRSHARYLIGRSYQRSTTLTVSKDHNGSNSCNSNGQATNPCPAATITGMISDGTAGTASGDGLANCMNQAKNTDVSAYYIAARIWNSGAVDSSGDLGKSDGATNCYSSDIANRLTGWTNAASQCTLDGASVSSPSSCPALSSGPSATSTKAATTVTSAKPATTTVITTSKAASATLATSTTKTSSTCPSPTCSWMGHCVGATCSTSDDCSESLYAKPILMLNQAR